MHYHRAQVSNDSTFLQLSVIPIRSVEIRSLTSASAMHHFEKHSDARLKICVTLCQNAFFSNAVIFRWNYIFYWIYIFTGSKHYADVLSFQKIYGWFPTDPYYGVDSKKRTLFMEHPSILSFFKNCNRRNKRRYES